ncbi:DUF3833 domain-containing protein [Henriciella marina]|uniref:DUF3833 domain-containing protein n=1 Tax=Henriciella marina TaxID=453851 RepID=UPI00037230E0|nr:DUF3833 domain-containing protein [Henriciella marina]
MRISTGLAPVLLAASVAVSGCVSNSLEDFSEAERTLRLEDYFLGETTAYGVFEDRFGKIRRQFKVDITGTVEGDTLTLVEEFDYSDGVRDTRTWTIEMLGNGRYRGTANDVPDMAEGRAVGNAFNWTYRVDLPVGDGTWNVGFDDWMYLLQDGVLLNRAFVTRFGIRIGEVTIAFRK